jgi:hypothetical protein
MMRLEAEVCFILSLALSKYDLVIGSALFLLGLLIRTARSPLMHNELGIARRFVPLEPSKVREFELIISLMGGAAISIVSIARSDWRWALDMGLSWYLTFFLSCLWIASNASLIVTPFKLRAVTSRPKGNCKSTFLTRGSHRGFLRTSLSSTVEGDVFTFLLNRRG